MLYKMFYQSPLGELLLTANESALLEVDFSQHEPGENNTENLPDVLWQTKRWLDEYFAGREPKFMPTCELQGSEFQMAVWQILLRIPYGGLTTYGEIARQIAAGRGVAHMSAQAVGGAVGRNPIAIIVPCHRVIGVGGRLTGYASGLDKKRALLALEGHDISRFNSD